MIRRIYSLLSSGRFLLWLIGGWIVYYVTSAVWSEEAFARSVTGLQKSLLFKIIFVIFIASAILNLMRASRERFSRGKAAMMLWIPLPFGVLLFLAGMFLSFQFRQFEWILAGKGDVVRPAWQEETLRVVEVKPALRDKMLEMEKSEFSIFLYEPEVLLDTPEGRREVGVYPPGRISGSYYHILRFGMAPGLRLIKDKDVLTEGYMALKIIPPGMEDTFEIKPYPYRFKISIRYKETIERDKVRARLYDLVNPLYEVEVQKGQEVIFRGSSEDEISFDGLTLSFFEPDYWVLLEVAKDPALAVVVSGIVLMALGLPISIFLSVRKIISASRVYFKE